MPFRLRLLWARLLSTCFQARCFGCRQWSRHPVCPTCASGLPRFSSEACPRCWGLHATCPLDHPNAPLYQVHAADPYQGPIRSAIHALKFDGRIEVAPWLGPRMAHALPELSGEWWLVPVPLSSDRLRARGYNQARLLAEAVGRYRVETNLLHRLRNTPSQVGLKRSERWEGMREAFTTARSAHGQRFILVDDVLTSGATLTWAAKALQDAGALEVRALVAARA